MTSVGISCARTRNGSNVTVSRTTGHAFLLIRRFLSIVAELSLESQFLNGNVKVDCIHNAIALKLDPYTVGPWTRKRKVELDLRTSIGDEWMRVGHIDQVVARGEHMTPGAEILLESFHGAEVELNARRESGYLFGGNGSYLDFEVFCVLG